MLSRRQLMPEHAVFGPGVFNVTADGDVCSTTTSNTRRIIALSVLVRHDSTTCRALTRLSLYYDVFKPGRVSCKSATFFNRSPAIDYTVFIVVGYAILNCNKCLYTMQRYDCNQKRVNRNSTLASTKQQLYRHVNVC